MKVTILSVSGNHLVSLIPLLSNFKVKKVCSKFHISKCYDFCVQTMLFCYEANSLIILQTIWLCHNTHKLYLMNILLSLNITFQYLEGNFLMTTGSSDMIFNNICSYTERYVHSLNWDMIVAMVAMNIVTMDIVAMDITSKTHKEDAASSSIIGCSVLE